MLHALIMAGGSGTRFWPASRDAQPKQLLKLVGDRTMIQATADRLGGLIDSSRLMVMTNQRIVDRVREQLPELGPGSVLGEPCRRDTAPCVGLAAAMIRCQDPQAIMLVLPADHVIQTRDQFQSAIRDGISLIERDPTQFVTFGIRPSYPAESFGYIERGKGIDEQSTRSFTVKRFREKPNRQTAAEYVQSGSFYWNSGIFMWRADALLSAIERFRPAMHEQLLAIADSAGRSDFEQVFSARFQSIVGESIDFAVMEHYPNIAVIEAPFGWDDVGSWQAIARLGKADEQGNAVRGSHVGIDTRGSIIEATEEHVVVTIDLQDMIVVHTPDATLVAPKHAEERVREAVAALRKRGYERLL
jgi:mannose-1-phosphate guanylyltransferase